MINLDTYLRSGILEAYCLGLLDPDKEKEIENLSLTCPQVNESILRIKSNLPRLLSGVDQELPTELKEKTWQILKNIRLDPPGLP